MKLLRSNPKLENEKKKKEGGKIKRIKYSKEAYMLLIELRDGTPVDSIDMKEGVILHLDS